MLVLEFDQYDKYLSDKEFMKYFKILQDKVSEIYPQINPNLELIIDKIYTYYFENYLINDLINRLYFDGHIIQFMNIDQP